MGRRKGQISMMGNSLLVKEKNKGQGPRANRHDCFLHTVELDDGTTYNRINFQSVTEQSNLEDFLTTAEMAGKDFTAERQNIRIITNPGEGKRLTDSDMRDILLAQNTHKALLQIPRRPPWDETTTKEDLVMAERDTFTGWRRQLKVLEEKEHIQLTPYEKNLDFWRQLWRVIERSDVVVQIVDARNPLLFRCEDLEFYVKEVDPNKTVMLLINKADYLTLRQREQWVEYFNKYGVRIVFFSAIAEKEKMEKLAEKSTCIDHNESRLKKEQNIDDNKERASLEEEGDNGDGDDSDDAHREDENVDADKDVDEQETLTCRPDQDVEDRLCSSLAASSPDAESDCAGSNPDEQEDAEENPESDDSVQEPAPENHTGIVSAEELLDVFRQLAQPSCSARNQGEVKTVGMVGYPNVGKSSTINVILQEKKLAVSATPGRTKHLQTLYVDDGLMLCDCPGLVFPSFVATKAHLVINGILPIDELRDHISPTSLVCDRIPRAVLEATYSIMIPRPSVDDQPDRPPTAEELLFAYGGMRGFMTARGVPDAPRASRYILKDYVRGKLLYCEPPPGINGADFQDKDRMHKLQLSRPATKLPPPQIKSAIDQEFFTKRQGKLHSRGKLGVADHVRVDTLQPSARQSEDVEPGALGSTASWGGSVSSLASTSTQGGSKPWKKHNNRNKKEKLRRVHRDLDVSS